MQSGPQSQAFRTRKAYTRGVRRRYCEFDEITSQNLDTPPQASRTSSRASSRGAQPQQPMRHPPAALLGRIAAEEAADLIVVGSRTRGRLRRGLESRLARQLETETPVPVLIAPPRTRRAGMAAS